MKSFLSEPIKCQLDYKITISHISKILEKEETIPLPGSIKIGKEYATKYLNRINNMLSSEYIDIDILELLQSEVKTDTAVVEADTAIRGYNMNSRDNSKMMNIILDFILSLYSPSTTCSVQYPSNLIGIRV